MKLIDKDTLVAELKRRINENREKQSLPQYFGMVEEDLNILSFLDTLEVKEIDLEKEFDKCCENYIFDDECDVYTAQHFFELGLKAQKGE